MAMKSVPNPDARFAAADAGDGLALDDLFAEGDLVVYTGSTEHYGAVGRVMSIDDDGMSVALGPTDFDTHKAALITQVRPCARLQLARVGVFPFCCLYAHRLPPLLLPT